MKSGRLITRRPKRTTIRRGLISVVLGVVLTVAVAWACALYVRGALSGVVMSGGPFFQQYRPESWPPLSKAGNFEGIGTSFTKAPEVVFAGDDPTPREPDFFKDLLVLIKERRSGFPWHSMYSMQSKVSGLIATASEPGVMSSEFEVIKGDQPAFGILEKGALPPAWLPHQWEDRMLPLRPMWPGALYSVLFYGVLVYSMVCLVEFGWRHRHFRVDYRRRHGQCLKCKYPVGAFAVCPECGEVITASGTRGSG